MSTKEYWSAMLMGIGVFLIFYNGASMLKVSTMYNQQLITRGE
jgi:hypothetical protein